MFEHCFLGIALHARVDGGEDTQSVGIDVVRVSVALEVLVAPSEERVLLPCDGVDDELRAFPCRIVFRLWLFRHHILAYVFAEIGCYALLQRALVRLLEFELYGLCCILLVFSLRDISCFLHLCQHHIAALAAAVGVSHGIEVRRVLAESDESGSLCHSEVFRVFVEVRACGTLYAYGVVEEVEVVEIHGYYLLLRVVLLQFNCNNPLYGFLQQSLHGAVCLLAIQLLCQLLGDGGAAAGALPSHDTTLEHRSGKGYEVHSRVFVEAFVLNGDKGMDEVR